MTTINRTRFTAVLAEVPEKIFKKTANVGFVM